MADSKFLEDEVDVSDVGEYSLARPSSFSILKAQNLGIFSSEEKKLNRESISFFCDFEGSDSEAKKQKQPNKKCCKVGEKESQSYILDPKNVYFCDVKVVSDGRTTLYIRNIPNKYTQRMLLEIIDKDISGDYDFFYLPIDYKVS